MGPGRGHSHPGDTSLCQGLAVSPGHKACPSWAPLLPWEQRSDELGNWRAPPCRPTPAWCRVQGEMDGRAGRDGAPRKRRPGGRGKEAAWTGARGCDSQGVPATGRKGISKDLWGCPEVGGRAWGPWGRPPPASLLPTRPALGSSSHLRPLLDPFPQPGKGPTPRPTEHGSLCPQAGQGPHTPSPRGTPPWADERACPPTRAEMASITPSLLWTSKAERRTPGGGRTGRPPCWAQAPRKYQVNPPSLQGARTWGPSLAFPAPGPPNGTGQARLRPLCELERRDPAWPPGGAPAGPAPDSGLLGPTHRAGPPAHPARPRTGSQHTQPQGPVYCLRVSGTCDRPDPII